MPALERLAPRVDVELDDAQPTPLVGRRANVHITRDANTATAVVAESSPAAVPYLHSHGEQVTHD